MDIVMLIISRVAAIVVLGVIVQLVCFVVKHS